MTAGCHWAAGSWLKSRYNDVNEFMTYIVKNCTVEGNINEVLF